MPDDIRSQVAERILTRAVAAGWDDLNPRQRSGFYRSWSEDAEIGGLIAQFLPRDSVRVWIKDGPMKEYARARRGLGPYAGLVPTTQDFEERIIARVLGEDWNLVPGTIDVKPARFMASNENGDRVLVLWGSPTDIKHLVWAWLNLPPDVESVVVVATSQSQPLTSDERDHILNIGAKLNADIRIMK